MGGENLVRPAARDRRRLTYDDFLLFPDDGRRHELIDGEHYVTPSPNLRHQDLLGRLHLAIATHLQAHPSVGRVFLSPFDVVFSQYDVVEPDLLFVAGDQKQILTTANVQGAPALVVEILSPGTRKRDQGVKQQLFDRGGVREYWLVDPDRNRIVVQRRTDAGGLSASAEFTSTSHDILRTDLMPGFALDLVEFFRPSDV